MVIIPAGVPRKPGMTRDDLFKVGCSLSVLMLPACRRIGQQGMPVALHAQLARLRAA